MMLALIVSADMCMQLAHRAWQARLACAAVVTNAVLQSIVAVARAELLLAQPGCCVGRRQAA